MFVSLLVLLPSCLAININPVGGEGLVEGMMSPPSIPAWSNLPAANLSIGWSPYAIPPELRLYAPNVSSKASNSGSSLPAVSLLASQVWKMKGYQSKSFLPELSAGCGVWVPKELAFSEVTTSSDYEPSLDAKVRQSSQACIQRMRNTIEGKCGLSGGLFEIGGCVCGFALGKNIDSIQAGRNSMRVIMDQDDKLFKRMKKTFRSSTKCGLEYSMIVDCTPEATMDITASKILSLMSGGGEGTSSVRQVEVISG